MTRAIEPILGPADVDALQAILGQFTADDVHARLGPIGRAAQERGDVQGALRALEDDDATATMIRLFLLGVDVPEGAARAVFGRLVDVPSLWCADAGAVR